VYYVLVTGGVVERDPKLRAKKLKVLRTVAVVHGQK